MSFIDSPRPPGTEADKHFDALIVFFRTIKGKSNGFRFKDAASYKKRSAR